jgi:PAS domain S-box-containing protein
MDLSSHLQNIRNALDSSAIVATTDPKGKIKYVNPKFIEISKYSESELIGADHRILNSGYHPKSFFYDMWKTISAGHRWEGDLCNRSKDGRLYWVHTIIIPFTDPHNVIEEFVSIRWEITDKKDAEKNLIETSRNLQSMLDASFEGLLIYDLSGHICWSNTSAQEIFEISQVKLQGLHLDEIFNKRYKLFHSDIQQVQILNAEKPHLLEVTTKPYFFQQHRAYLVTFRDITQKAKYESQMIQQDRLASVGILASGLAHEIGTPLGIMRGRAEMMTMIPNSSPLVVNNSDIIIQQIDRITHLIQNLLKLARGQEKETPQNIHVLTLISDVEDFLKVELTKNNIEFSIEVPENFELMGVHTSLFQVALNLLVNAIHAIQEARKTNPTLMGRIKIFTDNNESYNVLHFEDNGCGMSDETIKNLFIPFYTTKEIGKGTGLGLATSYKILQAWHGFMTVTSQPNAGSKFSIHIPCLIP